MKSKAYPYTTSVQSRRRRRFWNAVWENTPKDVLKRGIKDFHDETVRRVLSMTGRAGAWAKKFVMQEEAHPEVQGLSDRVYTHLDRGGSIYFNKTGAGHGAILARRYSYCAALFDGQYDDVPESEERRFFRECSTRAEYDLLEALEQEARRQGMELDLGRP